MSENNTSKAMQERLEAARSVVTGAGERFTPLRSHVLELIISDGGAIKAYDLLDRLSPDLGSPKPPTVYRALEFLSKHGLIHRVEALNAFIACEHNSLSVKVVKLLKNVMPMTTRIANLMVFKLIAALSNITVNVAAAPLKALK